MSVDTPASDDAAMLQSSAQSGAMPLSHRQLQALCCVIDTLIPSVDTVSEPAGFWLRKASDLEVQRHIVETIALLPRSARRDFGWLLSLLASPLPGVLLSGWPQVFRALKPAQRERLLLGWADSNLPALRRAFASLKRLSCFVYYGSSPGGTNPSWRALGYPEPPRATPAAVPVVGLRVSAADERIDCDTLVIGSGAGGGVVAATLTEHGQEVVIVDKGPYVPLVERSNLEFDMVSRLYEGRGMQATEDNSISLLAGSCLGGGTTVNWSVTLRPGQALLEEWAAEHHLPHLLGHEFASCIDEVCQRLSVVAEVKHNAQNRALLEGAGRMGCQAGPLPQNMRGCERQAFEHCGYCLYGCRHGQKQDVMEGFLKGAQARGSLRIHASTEVLRLHRRGDEITHAEAYVKSEGGMGRWVTMRARDYVLAAGAIQTPALLLANGFTHPHLGRNLHVHPTVLVIGQYRQQIESWRGGMMTSYCDAAANLDGHQYGCKIETAPLHCGLLAAALPWRGGLDHKQLMLAAAHYAGFAVITRDRYGGRVRVDRDRRPRVDYHLHEADRQHALQGMTAAVAIHAAAGAERVLTTHHQGLAFETRRRQLSAVEYRAAIDALDWAPNRFPVFSAHQMGSCRMGGRHADSPVMPDGRWAGMRNLFVADGSVFPSASGINPMVTIQALARHTALGMLARAGN